MKSFLKILIILALHADQ